ncbi:potassium-transporting ATPase subunit F [Nocardia spumae]|uniref:potassium-transporting ATPase subunit F n=1 Tax=Nocardia spumae TaxID=2887190 RepID=UPI001D151A59|nr:potassium-transporting ATPase subunit F [Nocardia spumae]
MPPPPPLRTRQRRRIRVFREFHSLSAHPHGCRQQRGLHYVCRGVHRRDRGDFRLARPASTGGGAAVIANIVGLVLALGVAVYMIAALLFPERF